MRSTRSSKTLTAMDETTGLSADGKILLNAMRLEFNQMKAEKTELVNAKNTTICELQSEIVQLHGELSTLKAEIDEADSYERRDCVIFSGNLFPPATPGEDCPKVVVETLKKELKININRSEINTVHRLGAKPTGTGSDNRKMIVKFVRRDLKKEIIVASKRVKDFYANESLTPTRRSILFSIRKIKKGHASIVKGFSTINGNVYAFTPPIGASSGRDVRHLINTREKLAAFCREYVKKELDTFLESWQK